MAERNQYRADKTDPKETVAMTAFSLSYMGVLGGGLRHVPADRWAFNFIEGNGNEYFVEVGAMTEKGFVKYGAGPSSFPIPQDQTMREVIESELKLIIESGDKPRVLINGKERVEGKAA